MSIKLIAIDLDGTWLRTDCSISEKNKKAISEAVDAGCIVVPTTGRSFRNAKAVLNEIPNLRYFINANGSTVTDAKKESLIYAETIPYQTSKAVYDMITQYESFAEIYEGLDAHVDAYGREFLLRAGLSASYVDQLLSTNIEHSCLDDFMEDPVRSICKFHIVCSSADLKNQLQRKLCTLENVFPVSVFSLNLEIVNGRWSKAHGLQKLTEHLGLKPEDVMAIGDSDNDLDMLRWAGISVGMGNANKHVKEVVDYITLNNDEDGVAYALEKYLQ